MSETELVYDFQTQLQKGKDYELLVENYFAETYGWRFTPAGIGAQRRGIDYFVQNLDGMIVSVEIKADFTAARTEHAFIETWSDVERKKRGWIYTSCAQMLLYGIPSEGLLYEIEMTRIKNEFLTWFWNYPIRQITNSGWYAEGLLVPLSELTYLCGQDNIYDELPVLEDGA